MITSVDTGKSFDKTHQAFMIKVLKRIGLDKTPQHNNDHI